MSDHSTPAVVDVQPLSGLRVLDLCRVVSGPFGSLLLADLGAEVIRVEPVAASAGSSGTLTEAQAFEWGMNRNKHSMAIDLKSDRGRELFYGLVAQADIVYDNFRPGVMKRLGLDRDTLAQYNPAIITCSLTGFGSDGPWAGMPAYDPIVQAMCGTLNYTRLTGQNPPVRWGIPIGDLFAGVFAAIGLTAAAIHRDRTGAGQHVDVSMLDVMLALNTYRVPQALSFDQEPAPSPFEGGQGTVPFGNYECSEGWVAICISQRMWPAACRIWGRPDLEHDPRFVDALTRHAHNDELVAILQDVFRTRPAQAWQSEMLDAGVVCARITPVGEVFDNPQVIARKMRVELSDAEGRTVSVAGDSLKFSDPATWRAPRRAGADTVMVLTELLDLPADEIAALADAGVVGVTEQPGGIGLAPRDGVGEPAAGSSPSERPLHGTTVLELNGDEPSKGFAAQFFADLGARVIRVDRPAGQIIEPYPDEFREAAFRAGLNRGKQSAVADLKTEEGRSFFYAMVAGSDVVLDNYRPGVLARLHIDGQTLRGINPRLISTSITGFGHTGPWSSYPAFDPIIQALAGGESLTVDHTNDTPIRWGNPIGGLTGAMFATLGTLGALRRRRRTGSGQTVDISLLDSQVALLSYRVPQALSAGKEFLPEPRRGGTGSLPFGVFRTGGDDEWFVICITQQFWPKFCEAAGHPEWAQDPRFATERLRQENEDALYALVEPSFLEKTGEEWAALYYELSIPGAKVLNLNEAFSHPQALARGMRMRVPDDEIAGGIEVAGPALKFSVSEPVPAALAPVPGRDTNSVAASFGTDAPYVEIDSPAQRWAAASKNADATV